MASHPGINTVEVYVDEAWHNVSDEQKKFIIDKYNSNEELKSYIENAMDNFDEENQSWRDYRNGMASIIDDGYPAIRKDIDEFIRVGHTKETIAEPYEISMDLSTVKPVDVTNMFPTENHTVSAGYEDESAHMLKNTNTTAQGKYHRLIPTEILSILALTDGWLVGSALSKLINGEKTRDFDIIVHPDNWHLLMQHIRNRKFVLNSNGGIKFQTESNFEVDIWVSSLDKFLKSRAKYTYIFNFNSLILLKSK